MGSKECFEQVVLACFQQNSRTSAHLFLQGKSNYWVSCKTECSPAPPLLGGEAMPRWQLPKYAPRCHYRPLSQFVKDLLRPVPELQLTGTSMKLTQELGLLLVETDGQSNGNRALFCRTTLKIP